MIDGSEKHKLLGFKVQSSHFIEGRSNLDKFVSNLNKNTFCSVFDQFEIVALPSKI